MNAISKGLVAAAVCAGLMSATAPAHAGEGRIPVWEPLTITCPCPPGNGPGQYVLTRDVAAIAGGGAGAITIAGVPGILEHVELDLNGFTVSGDPAGGSDAILAFGLRSLTIRNGSVRSLGAAPGDSIHVIDVAKVVIEDVKVENGTDGIRIENVTSFAVRRNVVAGVLADGIHVDNVAVPDLASGTIEDNQVRDTNGRGIAVENNFSSVSLRNNRLERAGGGGISAGGGESLIVAENTIEESNADGLLVFNVNVGKIHNNVSDRNAGVGLLLVGSAGFLVLDNVSSNNVLDGMIVDGVQNQIDRNVTSFNGACGLRFGAGSNGNTYGRNTSRGNGVGCACVFVAPIEVCPAPYGGGSFPPDFCNEPAIGNNTSFCDNLMPGPPRS